MNDTPITDVELAPPPVDQTTEVKVEKKTAAPVVVEAGALVPTNALELGAILTQISTGGGFPTRFDSKEKRMAAYNLAHSLMRDQWQLALNHIAIIKGQMCIYGELPGTLAERTGEVQEKEVYTLNAEYKRISVENKNLNDTPFAAVCKIQRKGRAMKEFTYSLQEAKNAGQYPPTKRDGSLNADSPWEKFFKVMLMRKAMGLAIKFEFPDALVGVPIAEYDYDEAPDLIDVTPTVDKAELLNNKFNPKPQPVEAQGVQQ